MGTSTRAIRCRHRMTWQSRIHWTDLSFNKIRSYHRVCSIHFISGYIGRQAFQTFACHDCKATLLVDEPCNSDENAILLDIRKRGKLVQPSKDLFHQITSLEKSFATSFKHVSPPLRKLYVFYDV